MKNIDWIEDFAKSSYQLFINHDPQSHLPFNAWGLMPLYNDLWLEKLHELVKKFRKNELQIKDNLNYFPNLSSTRFILLMVIIHYQISKLKNSALIVDVVEFLVESIRLRSGSDLFALSSNTEFSDQQIEKLLKDNVLNDATVEESKELGKILVALASLTHGLYNDWCTDYNYEISGPYKTKDKIMLLRYFPDCNPKEIWPDLSWKFKNVSVITEYANLDANIAFVGCHITYSDNVIEKLERYSLNVDGKIIQNLEELKKLREDLMQIASKQYKKFMTMDFENQKIKFVEQENYQLKKLFELLKMDWRPSEEILERIKNKQLIDDIFPNYQMSLEDYKKTFGINRLIEAYEDL